MTNFGIIIVFILTVCAVANVWLWLSDKASRLRRQEERQRRK